MWSLKKNGLKATAQKVRQFLVAQRTKNVVAAQHFEPCMDVLFINGCSRELVPHPPRYRISHQQEQLIANNIVSSEVYYEALSLNQVRNYRVFIFFRCPVTPVVEEFISRAKKLHKTVLFDIDDLVVDTKYTDTIPYVKSLSPEEKEIYDDGVIRMGRTLRLCDGAITTTERLAQELRHYVPEVIINRNTASELMLKHSEEFLRQKREPQETTQQATKKWWTWSRKQEVYPKRRGVRLGYFSGSITHNADVELILPALVRVLKENSDVELHIVGELDLPKELEPFEKQVITREFVDWQELPALIGSVDVNLAPLEDTIFNEAKSENKWVEAALVKVPTVASDVGAFHRMIRHNETGLLCRTKGEWYQALKRMIQDSRFRSQIAEKAYEYCRKNCVTTYTGFSLAKYIRSKMTPNVAFVLPSLNISGGIMVALRHAGFLFDLGMDVFIISETPGNGWIELENHRFPVISKNHHPIYLHIDKAVATMWTTVQFLEVYPAIKQRYYLVQNFETDFYEPDIFLRIQANQSYSPNCDLRFLTISKWCQRWLEERFEQMALYAPNGIDSASFRPRKRILAGKKIRILVEGDSASHYKNVDESFRVVERLDPEKFEVWYMSYNAEPKESYRVDRFLHCVPYEKVFEVYGQCDILLKSSWLESFSYPPLEMMASGGYAVVVPNDGNQEYLADGENCLLYQKGDIDGAVKAIERLCRDSALQEKLYEQGLKTAMARDWSVVREDIFKLYDMQAGEMPSRPSIQKCKIKMG